MSVTVPIQSDAEQARGTKRKAENEAAKGDKVQKKRQQRQKPQTSPQAGSQSAPQGSVSEDSTNTKSGPHENPATNDPTAADGEGEAAQSQAPIDATSRKVRFIVFIGNLPYTCTTEAIETHFSSVRPDSIRHITQKSAEGAGVQGPKKGATGSKDPQSKGFAFLEFSSYDRMKACLKTFHHSKFKDGKSPARKINVELTAGGGGSKDVRRQRLREKNERLQEQRKRRLEKEQEQKAEARKEGRTSEKNAQQESTEAATDVHPSRRSRVKY